MSHLSSFVALLPDFCRSLVQIGLSVLLQSTLLLLIGWGMGHRLRRRGPSLQSLVYGLTFVGVVVCGLGTFGLAGRLRPLFSLSLPTAHTTSTHPTASVQTAGSTSEASSFSSPDATPDTGMQAKPTQEQNPSARVQVLPAAPIHPGDTPVRASVPLFQGYMSPEEPLPAAPAGWLYVALVGVWLGVALGLLAWLLFCYLGVRRILARSVPVEGGEARALLGELCTTRQVRAPLLLASREVQSIYLTGLFRPAILLPATDLGGFDLLTLRAVLAHEVAHLSRRDELWTLLLRLLRAVLWFQPLLWILIRQWEQASEERCDLAVLEQDVPPRAYADCLLRLAERFLVTRTERVVGAGILTFSSSLGRRIQRLLAPALPPSPGLTPRMGWALLPAMVVVAVPVLMLVRVFAPTDTVAWADDTRLDRRVAISAEGISVGDLLTLLSEKTGMALQADAAVADEKVIVFSPARPLRQVLTDLAALFNDVWTPTTSRESRPGYLLSRSSRIQKYEDTLTAALNQRLLAQLDAQVQALNETPQELAQRPSGDLIRKALTDPKGRLTTGIFARLTPEQRTALIETWSTMVPIPTLPTHLQGQLKDYYSGERTNELTEHGWTWKMFKDSSLSFVLLGPYQETTLRVGMSTVVGTQFPLTEFSRSTWYLLPPHGNPYTGNKVLIDVPRPDAYKVNTRAGSWPDHLRALAEKTGQPVMSDYYRSKPVLQGADTDRAAPGDTPAGVLDAFCRPEGALWWTESRTLFFRKRDWYYQRRYEVPDRWVLGLTQKLQQQNGLPTYEDVLRLRELTPDQTVGLYESMGMISAPYTLAYLHRMLKAANLALTAQQRRRNETIPIGKVSIDPHTREASASPDWKAMRQHQAASAMLFMASLYGTVRNKDGTFSELPIQPYRRDQNSSRQPEAYLFFEAFRTPISAETIYIGDEYLIPLSEWQRKPTSREHLNVAFLYRDKLVRTNELFMLPLALPDDRRSKTRITMTP